MVEILFIAGDEGCSASSPAFLRTSFHLYPLRELHALCRRGEFFHHFTIWAAGVARGGAAKIAIIASALYGP